MNARLTALALLLPALVAFEGVAHAAPPAGAPPDAVPAPAVAPAPLAASLTGEAKTEYESGKNLFEIGDFRGALLKFAHAFDLSAEPRLLWNMAACEKEAHRYARAVNLVERYLKTGGEKITPEARANATGTLEALKGLYSRVTVEGAPTDAKLYVDDEAVELPFDMKVPLDVGTRRLRFEHPDFEPLTRSLEITGGKDESVTVEMQPLPAGRLAVVASPGDTIVVDGKVVGTERWESRVQPGQHTLRVTAVGKKPYEATVQVTGEGIRTIQVSLQEQKKSALWPYIVGGLALASGAAVGGYFIFKPEDQPGAFTSGGLGTVILPGSFR